MRHKTHKHLIPHFGLYGESAVKPDPGFVHIEAISERSMEAGWRISPHRHGDLFQAIFISQGGCDARLDEQDQRLDGHLAITIPPGTVHAFRFKPNTVGSVLSVSDAFFADAGYRRSRAILDELVQVPQVIQFDRESVLFAQLFSSLDLMHTEFQQSQSGSELMLNWQVNIVLMTLRRQLENRRLSAVISKPSSKLLHGFRSLLEENFRRHWTVDRYATALNTSVSSLNRRCNEYVGLTAKTIIQNRILVEAKRRLIYSKDPVDHVAYELGFRDPAYFSRFFKRQVQMPPGQYREAKNLGL